MTASTGSDQLEGGAVNSHLPGLTEQINNIESLVTRLVTRNEEMVRSQQENIINGNTLGEAELESQLGEKRSFSRSLDEQRPNFWVIMSEQNLCSACAALSVPEERAGHVLQTGGL